MPFEIMPSRQEYVGLSTDTLPVDGIPDGSWAREIDTRKRYTMHQGVWYDYNNFTDVSVQDQTTPPFLVKANRVTGAAVLAVQAEIGDYSVQVIDASQIAPEDYIGIFETDAERYYVGTAIGVNQGTGILTLDTPIDSVFPIGSLVGAGATNMNVDGSITPVEFNVRGADPGVDITIDVTRLMFNCITTDAVNLTDFGDITNGLLRGLVIRYSDGYTKNILNFKTNIEMKGAMFDWDSLDDTNPGQGLHGFAGRLSFAGPSKMGVAIRIAKGEKLSFLVQDNLTSLLSFEILVEGHEVE